MGGLRAGTVNTPYMIGMGLALEMAVKSTLNSRTTEVRRLRDKLEDAILSIEDVEVIGDREDENPEYDSCQLQRNRRRSLPLGSEPERRSCINRKRMLFRIA